MSSLRLMDKYSHDNQSVTALEAPNRMHFTRRPYEIDDAKQGSLQVVEIMTFQTKLCTKSCIFFPKELFYPIKTIFGCHSKFLFYLEKWLFSNHSHLGRKSDFY